MRRGPKPQPTRLKVLRGNPGKRKLNVREPLVSPAVPNPPDWLGREAVAKWDELCEMLGNLGILTHVDADVLTLYCRTWVRWKTAEQGIDTEGLVVTSPSGIKKRSPLAVIAKELSTELRALQAELGMTPSARTRVQTVSTPRQRPAKSKWAGILTP